MLLQTNSYIVPKDKRAEHARLLRRFRASLAKLGCDSFEVYEQVGSNWTTGEPTGRYVQIMRFRDRRHQLSVQAAERSDPAAQAIIAEFCQLINFPYQQQQGLFAVGFYNSVLPVAPSRPQAAAGSPAAAAAEAPVHEEGPAQGHHAGPDMPGASIGEVGAGEAEGEHPNVEHTEVEHAGGAEDAAGDEEAVEPPMPDGGTLVDSELSGGDHAESADVTDGSHAPDAEAEETADAPLETTDVGSHAAEASNAETTAADVDELGSLLDEHLDTLPEAESTEHAEAALADSDDAAEDNAGGLDAMDLDGLDLPDAPETGPQHASKHVAR